MAAAEAGSAKGPSVVGPAIVYVILFGGVGAWAPYATLFYAEAGFGLAAVGALSALNAVVALVAAPAWGMLVDRLRAVRGPLLAAGLLALGGGLTLSVARDPLVIVLGIALLAAAASGMAPLIDTRTIELLGADRDRFGRARAWGSAAFIVVAVATGVLIEATRPSILYAVNGVGLALAGIVAYVVFRRPAPSGSRAVRLDLRAGLTGIVRAPSLGRVFVASVLLWTSVYASLTYVPIHLSGLGGDGPLIGSVWAVGAAVEVPLMLLFPRIVRRTGPGTLLVVGAAAFAARSLGWAVAGDPAVFVLWSVLGGVGFTFIYVGTVSYVARHAPPSAQATAQGLFSGTAAALGSILGSLAAGALVGLVGVPGLLALGGAAALGTAALLATAVRAVRST